MSKILQYAFGACALALCAAMSLPSSALEYDTSWESFVPEYWIGGMSNSDQVLILLEFAEPYEGHKNVVLQVMNREYGACGSTPSTSQQFKIELAKDTNGQVYVGMTPCGPDAMLVCVDRDDSIEYVDWNACSPFQIRGWDYELPM